MNNSIPEPNSRIKKIRELYRLSQPKIAKIIGIPQPNYARYELGKAKKLPYSFLIRFSELFYFDTDWLLSGTSNLDRCHSIRDHVIINKVNHDDLAHKLNVPTIFLDAIISAEVTPSADFTKKIFEAMGLQDQSEGYTAKMSKALSSAPTEQHTTESEIDRLREDYKQLRKDHDHLILEKGKIEGCWEAEHRQLEELKRKNDELQKIILDSKKQGGL